MSTLYLNLKVPIPSGSREYKDTNPGANGKIAIVDIHYDVEKRKRIRIGVKADDAGFMHPNDEYFKNHAGEYHEYLESGTVDKKEFPAVRPHELKVGLFAVVLAIALNLQIYAMLLKSHGAKIANAIMDYVCFLIRNKCNSVHLMTCEMYDYVMFTTPLYSDSWYSELYSDSSMLDMNNFFQDMWIIYWVKNGVSEVYLCIDGCNIDCEATGNEDAERGKDKSGQHTTIISFMWAIVGNGKHKGMPLSYVTYNGSQVDCAGIKRLIAKLEGYGLKVKGGILDRGFCTENIMIELPSIGIPFIIMMTEKTGGHQEMVKLHGEKIRNATKYYAGKGRYGTVDRTKVFKTSDLEAYIVLYYDPLKAAFANINLVDKVYNAAEDIIEAIRLGKKYAIPQKYEEYISVISTEKDGKSFLEVKIDHDRLDDQIRTFGFSTIATYDEKTPKEVSEIYDLRESSELAYKYFKTPLGGKTIRVHTSTSAKVKMFPGVIAVTIYNEFQRVCSSVGSNVASILPELDRLTYTLTNGIYVLSDGCKSKTKTLLRKLGITIESLVEMEKDINRRYSATLERNRDYIHTAPWAKKSSTNEELSGALALEKEKNDPAPWDFSVAMLPDTNESIGEQIMHNSDALDEAPSSSKPTNEIEQSPNEAEKVQLTTGKVTKFERQACTRDIVLGELVPEQVNSNIMTSKPKQRGRKKGTKDTKPRKRRTKAELGIPYKVKPRSAKTSRDGKNNGGRPEGAKDSYPRVRRTNAELGKPTKASSRAV